MLRLEHVFAAGLIFDTEIQYLAQTGRGLRYARLPILKAESAHEGALNSVMQCVLLLGETHSRQLLPKGQRVAQESLGEAPCPGAFSILRCIRTLETLLEAQPVEIASTVEAPDMGETVLQALRQGEVCLLHYGSSKGSQWATVTGVELAVDGDEAYPRALLLLDSLASEPWACGHNVRIELKPVRGRLETTTLDYPLVCRHLTGDIRRVKLLSLITLKRREQPADRP